MKHQHRTARICAELGRISTAQEQQADAMGTMAKAFTTLAKATTSLVQRMDERSQAEAILAERRAKNAERMRDKRGQANADLCTHCARKDEKDGTREETTPLHPPKEEKKGEKEERSPSVLTRVREVSSSSTITTYNHDGGPKAEELPITPLTFKQLQDMARSLFKCTDEPFLREVFNEFEAAGWRDKHNKPMNPGYMLSAIIKHRSYWQKWRDPDRLPDARKAAAHRVPHADNWRDMDPSQKGQHVF